MTTHSIGPERDDPLGALLREALAGADDAAFAVRVRAALEREPRDGTWEVLARWLRPGLAAAGLLALLGGAALLARVANQRPPSTAQLLVADDPGARDVVLADLLEGR
ncbi:MAG: hypothetical protein MUC69_03055 [Gemmatimonadales bacterium]|jgi:hypothetical protein|nr:hypothetical protein [Gemmatimonadales bacterium]